jgi:CheY-like chemotaxis protein
VTRRDRNHVKQGASVTVKVFLVEDLAKTAGLMKELFDSLGYTVTGSVATEAEAYQWLGEHTKDWDLAVVDLVLEQGTGFGVVQRCRESSPHGKAVVFSSFVSPAVRDHLLAMGADAVIDKSDSPALVAYCAAFAEAARARAEAQLPA